MMSQILGVGGARISARCLPLTVFEMILSGLLPAWVTFFDESKGLNGGGKKYSASA